MHKFKQLTKEERKKYVVNIISLTGEHNLHTNLKYFTISSAFTWDDSPEGHDYWRSIANRIQE